MKHQRNFLSSILKFILITAAVLILLLFVSCVLFSFYYKDIFLHFFQRDVSVGKVTFDITNLSKTAIGVPTINHHMNLDIIVDYDNGFRYVRAKHRGHFALAEIEVYGEKFDATRKFVRDFMDL